MQMQCNVTQCNAMYATYVMSCFKQCEVVYCHVTSCSVCSEIKNICILRQRLVFGMQ